MARVQNRYVWHQEENLRGRFLLFFLVLSDLSPTLSSSGKTKSKNPYDEKRLLEQNKRRQKENNAPEDFPNFVREGLCCNGRKSNHLVISSRMNSIYKYSIRSESK